MLKRFQTKTIVWPLLSLLARCGMAWLASRVLLALTRTILPPKERASAGRPRRALALNFNKAGVRQDIEETFRGGQDYELIVWPSYVLRAIAAGLLASTLDHNNYLSDDPRVEQSKLRYRDFLHRLWVHYRAVKPVDVVVAGNFAYSQQREFGAALEDAGTPFIAIHKENVRPPKRVKDYWFHVYKERRGPFAGRKILVYNDVERALQISSGVAAAEHIVVTGMPRLDLIHRWRREHGHDVAGLPGQVLFFSFSRQNKLTAPGRKPSPTAPKGRYEIHGEWGNLNWNGLWTEAHIAVIEIARQRSDLHVVIKTKGNLEKDPDLARFLENDVGVLPPNVEIVVGGNPFTLITRSCVVAGFNTTGLLEAIAAGKPVVVPHFLEAADPARQDLIIDLGDAVDHADCPQAFADLILQHAARAKNDSSDLPAKASRVLRHWVGNDDGHSGQRALSAIDREIRTTWPATGAKN